ANGDPAINGVQSGPIILTPGGEPTNDGDTDPNSNLSIDFGFHKPTSTALRLGNHVWYDANNNGLLDAGEMGLSNVTVNLLDSVGNVLSATTTTAGGFYTFTNLSANTYIVEIPAANFTGTGVLSGFMSSTPNEVNGANGDLDDNGVNEVSGGIRSNPVTLAVGNAPTLEGDEDGAIADGNSDLTIDFGFFEKLRLGNRVWFDPDNDGQIDASEQGIANVTLCLLDGVGNPITDSITGLPRTSTTDANGYYLFDDLAPGAYIVCVEASNFTAGNPLQGSSSSTPTDATPDNDEDSDDNGIDDPNPATNGIQSGVINLANLTEPTAEDGENGSFIDTNSNLTVDFGFFGPLSLGNQVWTDTNNNGQIDPGEMGVPNVVVNLLDSTGTTILSTTTTNAGGFYTFTNLISGTYIVSVPPTNFQATGPLENCVSSTPTEIDPNLDGNNNDNGIANGDPAINGVQSGPIILTPGGEPTNDGDTDPNSNLSIDFGFHKSTVLRLGNQVWFDLDNDGLLSSTEDGVAGVLVNLIDSSGNVISTTTTNAGGFYTFTNLITGTYIVEIDASNFAAAGVLNNFASSTPDIVNGTDGDADDNGVPHTNGGVRSAPVDLAVNTEPTIEPHEDGVVPNSNSNLTIDFGFYQLLSLGNLIWADNDNDGERDPGESGIPGVVVHLQTITGATILTTTTDASGLYTFTHLISGTYVVSIPPVNFEPGGALEDCVSSTPTESDPNTDIDDDDNGINDGDPVFNGVQTGEITLTTGDEPPTNGDDGDTDPNTNWSIDLGFHKSTILRLGNQVWFDLDNDGLLGQGENGVPGAIVNLLDSTGTTILSTTTTNAGGFYTFTNLITGTYIVEIDASNFEKTGVLGNYASSQPDVVNGADGDNDDNGVPHATGSVRSDPVVLAVGTEPTGEPHEDGILPSNNSNLTIDFGFFELMAIGNLVWYDYFTNTTTVTNTNPFSLTDNSNWDSHEYGVSGVVLTLQLSGTTIATTTTNATGHYSFTRLYPGVYSVTVLASNFFTMPANLAGPLAYHLSSDFNNVDTDNNMDDDDNGNNSGAPWITGISSEPIELAYHTEPDMFVDDDDNDNTNFTVDFGFWFPPATFVDLLYFRGVSDNGTIHLSWETAVENDTFGFRVMRSTTSDLTNAIEIVFVLRQGTGTGGAVYAHDDTSVLVGEAYYYWLIEVETNGAENTHGPIYVNHARVDSFYLPLIAR
ncbi:MAG: SdrD B-like domain-containing protein, partial [Chloroflexota bacterium]